jgi:hypothetical protein
MAIGGTSKIKHITFQVVCSEYENIDKNSMAAYNICR